MFKWLRAWINLAAIVALLFGGTLIYPSMVGAETHSPHQSENTSSIFTKDSAVGLIQPAETTTSGARTWMEEDMPGPGNGLLLPGTSLTAFDISPDGETMFAYSHADSGSAYDLKLYRSADSGTTWVNRNLGEGLNGKAVSKLTISPLFDNDESLVALAENSIHISNDAGEQWEELTAEAAIEYGAITTLDVSYNADNEMCVLFGWKAVADPTAIQSGVGIFVDRNEPCWVNLSENEGYVGDGDVLTLAFSPDFATDNSILVITSTDTGAYLQSADLDFSSSETVTADWDSIREPILLEETGIPEPATSAYLAFPIDYESDSANRVFVSTSNSKYGEAFQVSRFSGGFQVFDLGLSELANDEIASMAYNDLSYHGALVIGIKNGMILSRFIENNIEIPPDESPDQEPSDYFEWENTDKYCSPTGVSPLVIFDPNPRLRKLYAATKNGEVNFGSALFKSDYDLFFTGIALISVPDLEHLKFDSYANTDCLSGQSLLLVKYAQNPEELSPGDIQLIFRKNNYLKPWYGVFSNQTTEDLGKALINVVVDQSPYRNHDYYIIPNKGPILAYINNDSFSQQQFFHEFPVFAQEGIILDFTPIEPHHYFIASPEGIFKDDSITPATIEDKIPFRILYHDSANLFVTTTSGEVYLSTDDGDTFQRLGDMNAIGMGPAFLALDADYDTNKTIYAASSKSNQIYRWTVGSSLEWENAGTLNPSGMTTPVIDGIWISDNDALYVLMKDGVDGATTTPIILRNTNPALLTDSQELESITGQSLTGFPDETPLQIDDLKVYDINNNFQTYVGVFATISGATFNENGLLSRVLVYRDAFNVVPVIDSQGVYGTTQDAVILSVHVSNLGAASEISLSFEWGNTTVYGHNTPLQTVSEPGNYEATIAGLRKGKTYHVRAKAVGDGVAYGKDIAFNIEPAIITESASCVTTTSAILNASLPQQGTAYSVYYSFEYGITTEYGNVTGEKPGENILPGDPHIIPAQPFKIEIDGLMPGQTYHYRAKIVGNGTAYGQDVTFQTPPIPAEPPTVETLAATNISARQASFNANVSDLGTSTGVKTYFEYWLEPSEGEDIDIMETGESITTLTDPGTYSKVFHNLKPGKLYHYRAKVLGDGISYGPEQTFKTLIESIPPEVEIGDATEITDHSAVLHATLTKKGDASPVYAHIECNEASDEITGIASHTYPLMSEGDFTMVCNNLKPNTLYYYKAKVYGDDSMSSDIRSFKTLPAVLPQFIEKPARDITTTTATIEGNITDMGSIFGAGLSFEYGKTNDYGNVAQAEPWELYDPEGFTAYIIDLSPNTQYHFRVKTYSRELGSVYGVDQTFTTKKASSGKGGGGGSGSTTPTFKPVITSGLSASTDLRVNTSGIVEKACQLKTEAGEVVLDIAKNTQMLDALGNALSEFSCTRLNSAAELPPDQALILAIEFGPNGAKFNPPITLSMTYNPDELPSSVSENELFIAFFDGSQWQKVETTIDTLSKIATAKVSHFSSFALLGKIEAMPTPAITAEPVPVDTPTPPVISNRIGQETTKPEEPKEDQPLVKKTSDATVIPAVTVTPDADKSNKPPNSIPLIVGIISAILVILLGAVLIFRRRQDPGK